MGKKGDKLNQDSIIAADLIIEKLGLIDGITTKKMFGGHGIFHEGKMFCIVDSKGNPFLKADETTRADYEEKGSHKHSRMPYFSIPDDVLDDLDLFIAWAKKSIAISK